MLKLIVILALVLACYSRMIKNIDEDYLNNYENVILKRPPQNRKNAVDEIWQGGKGSRDKSWKIENGPNLDSSRNWYSPGIIKEYRGENVELEGRQERNVAERPDTNSNLWKNENGRTTLYDNPKKNWGSPGSRKTYRSADNAEYEAWLQRSVTVRPDPNSWKTENSPSSLNSLDENPQTNWDNPGSRKIHISADNAEFEAWPQRSATVRPDPKSWKTENSPSSSDKNPQTNWDSTGSRPNYSSENVGLEARQERNVVERPDANSYLLKNENGPSSLHPLDDNSQRHLGRKN